MKLKQIRQILDAKIAPYETCTDASALAALMELELSQTAYASDMMSDVLAFVTDQTILVTGLVNEQVIRTAAMLDMCCVILVCGKQPSDDMLKLAQQNEIVILTTEFNLYEACGQLFSNGLREGC